MASMHDAIVYMYDLSTTNTHAYGKTGRAERNSRQEETEMHYLKNVLKTA